MRLTRPVFHDTDAVELRELSRLVFYTVYVEHDLPGFSSATGCH